MTPDVIIYIAMAICIVSGAVASHIALTFWLSWKNTGNEYIKKLAIYLTTAPVAMILVSGLALVSDAYVRKDLSYLVIITIGIYVITTGVLFLLSSIDKRFCGGDK